MKSSAEDLYRRGYVEEGTLFPYENIEYDDLLKLLKAKEPFVRTTAIRYIGQIGLVDKELAIVLLKILQKEKALYTRIEICTVLQKGTIEAVREMISYVGKIGNNQYQEMPDKVSKKISFPLPRDSMARTLGRMPIDKIDLLFSVLEKGERNQITEVLDAIGLMTYNHPAVATTENFRKIQHCIMKHKKDSLLVWKGMLCLSAFPLEENDQYLQSCLLLYKEKPIMEQIKRSVRLIQNKINTL